MSIHKKIPDTKIPMSSFNGGSLLGKFLFIGILLSVSWAVYFSIATISIPYQIEFREGAALVTTDLLLNGVNPYEIKSQPLGTNVYGVGYSLVALPFVFLFGNSLLIHRAVTFVFVLLSAGAGFAAVYKERRDALFAFGCAAFIMIGLIGYGGIGAFPAAMGAFLFLTAVALPFARSFDKTSLLISAFTAIFSFYTKPYFILAFGIVAAYLFLFVSKKKAVFYSVAFFLLFAAFFTVIRIVFPLYFINIIIANVFLSSKTVGTLLDHLRRLFMSFYPILALAVAVLVKDLFDWQTRPSFSSDVKKTFDLANWDAPFSAYPVNYFFHSFACSFLAFVLILGPHDGGTGVNYANQLLTPLFCIWLFQKISLDNRFRFAVVLILLFNLFAWEQKALAPVMLEQKNSKAWAELFGYIESSPRVLNSQFTVSRSVELGLELTDSGQTILFYQILPYPDYAFIGPSYKAIRARSSRYSKAISRAIEEQKFDLVITAKEKSVFFDLEPLYQYYTFVKELEVDMPQTEQTWTALVWKRSQPK